MTLSRRNLLTFAGGIAAAATVTACGSNTGGIGTSTTPTASATGPLPELTQWYHEYGEAGTQDAVKKHVNPAALQEELQHLVVDRRGEPAEQDVDEDLSLIHI